MSLERKILRCSIRPTWNLLFLCIIRFERVAMAQHCWDLEVLKVWTHEPSFELIYINVVGEKWWEMQTCRSMGLMFSLSNRRSNKSRALGSCQKMPTWVEWVFSLLCVSRNIRFFDRHLNSQSIFKSKSLRSIKHWDDLNYTVLVEVTFLVKLNCIISMPASSVYHWFLFSLTLAEQE